MQEKPPHLRHGSDFARKFDRRALKHIQEAGRDDPRSEYITWSVESQSEPIRHLERSLFALPPGISRFVGDEPTRVLQDLLYEVWELNERFVGQPQLEAFIQINGTPEQLDINKRSLDWAGDYVTRRLRRPNNRDRGCPYRKFHRLYNELIPFIDELGIIEDSQGKRKMAAVTGQFLGQMCDYMAWSFFESTWMGDVTWKGSRVGSFRERSGVDPLVLIQCRYIFAVYDWKLARVFDILLRRMAQGIAAQEVASLEPEEELARIERLADDIHEMRPFLVRNFRPSRAVVELPGELVAHFVWGHGDRVGMLRCAESDQDLLAQEHRSEMVMPLGINYRGVLTCLVNPWQTVISHEEALPTPALAVGRVVLEAVHGKLFDFYDQVDVDAILARWGATDSEEPASAEEEAMVIAASIASVAVTEEPARETRRITSSLRLSRLQSLLERRFGCTARPGKGSELLFYREGRRHAFVGRHKANPRVSAVGIQSILRKLGITVREWLQVTCG